MFLANRHSLWLRLRFMVEAAVLVVSAPGGCLIARFTADSDRAGIAADLAALHQHLDLLLPEET
jgi:hypothetical protein